MLIAKDGFSILGILAVLAALSYRIHPYITVLFVVLFVFTGFFFRDPVRRVPQGSMNTVYSPADGTIFEINDVEMDGKPYQQVVIFLSVFNVHINRIPYKGRVISSEFIPGKFYAAFKKGIQKENQRQDTYIETDKGMIRVVQITGAIARRIVCRLLPNQEVSTGEKFGMIKFGSRTDLYLPKSAQIEISIGQKVRAGLTVIANFSS